VVDEVFTPQTPQQNGREKKNLIITRND